MGTANQSERTKNAHTAIGTLAWLIEEAFEGDPSHSLIANLHDVREEDWTATPLRSHRSIADILEHMGWSKWMYEDYAFGSATLRGDQPPLVPKAGWPPSAPWRMIQNWRKTVSPIGANGCRPATLSVL
jgi:hypothetical protein